MNGDPTEIELKFEIDPDALTRLKADPRLAQTLEPARDLLSTYFDTDDRRLRDAGFTLRIRRDEERCLQTVKSAGDGGLFSRGEWETEIKGEGIDMAAAMDTPLKPLLETGAREGLKPLFATRVRRQIGRVSKDGSDIEVSLDEGEIEGDGRRSALSEIELELKTGVPASLFALAQDLFGEAPLKLSFVSKAERGYALVDGGGKPRKLKPAPPLKPGTKVGRAFQAVCRLCLVQLSANERTLRGTQAPEAIHQSRVALRRLRSAMSIFKGTTADAGHALVKAELEWLAGELDDARNLDVFARETFLPLAEATPAESGMAAFGELILEAKSGAYERAIRAAESDRCRLLLLDTARWIEAGEWAVSEEPLFRERREMAVGKLARAALNARLKAVSKRGEALEGSDPIARHKLRIRVKKLRYAAEFFSALYPKKAQGKFIETLRGLQDALGGLNDIVVGHAIAAELTRQAPPPAVFAAGVVSGRQAAREKALLKDAKKAYARLMEAERYWG